MYMVRLAQFFVALVLTILFFQNCAVEGGGGALSLGSSNSATGSSTGGTDSGGTTSAACTCPALTTVACDQPVIDSCGVQCGLGTQGCIVRCANVDSRCLAGGNQFRHNVGGGGCGSGGGCNINGEFVDNCSDCPCAPCRP